MPKVAKTKSPSRPSPLKATNGNAKKKPTTSPKAKASDSSPKTQTKSKAATRPAPSKSKTTQPGATAKGTTSTKQNSIQKSDSPNYLLLTRLRDTDDPTITRFLSVPPTLTFSGLHHVMRIAFGWRGMHMHNFYVNKVPPVREDDDEEDEDELDVGPSAIIMRIQPETNGDQALDEDYRQSDTITLADVFENEEYAGKVDIEYNYDFGDDWHHDIVFMGKESPGLRRSMGIPRILPIACLGGEGHPCAEDCGGIEGWEGLKEVFTDSDCEDGDDLKGWYKTVCGNGDKNGLNPYKWDVFDVNEELMGLAEELGLC